MRLPRLAPLLCSFVFSCGDLTGSGGGGGGDASGGGTDSNGGGGGTASSGGGSGSTGGGTASSGGGTSSNGGGTGITGSVTVIVEPSDNAAALKAAITNAKTSVHMTMYLLSNNGIINALIAQKNAGHEVKVLLNQNLPTGDGSNGSVFNQLTTAGVSVKWAPATFTLTHEKCVIVDGTTAWIMTMNATGSAPTDNREYLAVDTQPNDVAEAEAIFAADFAPMTINPSGTLLVAPNNAGARLVAFIGQAAVRIDMEAEELSDMDTVTALVAAQNRGVTVHIVLADNTPTSSQTTAVATLKAAGVKLVTLHSPYIHAKALAVDSKTAYVGSENFTTGSLVHNRELGVFVTDDTEVGKIVSTTNTDFANGTAL